jgi:DNA modification methylase
MSLIELPTQQSYLAEIAAIDSELEAHFAQKFLVQPTLTRAIVSFQANKIRPVYRWYKYKEAFSASLVEYLFRMYEIERGVVFDPFAGSGTTLFAANDMGLDAEGIELLPIGQEIIVTKQLIDAGLSTEEIERLRYWSTSFCWQQITEYTSLPELRITKGAYPEQTKIEIAQYLTMLRVEDVVVQRILCLALLCVLEAVSYTRKDGQYLRWDHRSGRRQGEKIFDKGTILPFDQAISGKIKEILSDILPHQQQNMMFDATTAQGKLILHRGSCLEIMPQLPSNSYSAIMTSPPYCNRYDYTRTYALELALLGVGERDLVNLRQAMVSCTVENRAKDLLGSNPAWHEALTIADNNQLLQTIIRYLEHQKTLGSLNNNGIPRMVQGYFYEMACVIAECGRVLRQGAPLFMVNDNVRYAGASISVDMILSDFAEHLGFEVEKIMVLPGGKGNSSQQMGEHGRDALRKCVYVRRNMKQPLKQRTLQNLFLSKI